jgi:beta-ribofuranosylaminobenzene 5'-phosphate synthase
MLADRSVNEVRVAASARLHLGFLDLHGGLGRKFGGLGLAIDGPQTRLTLTRAEETSVEGPHADRAASLLEKARSAFAPDLKARLVIHEAIPAHAGLGSGTQLALAIAAALRRLEDVAGDAGADAAAMGRGARSGLGAGLFEQGGFVVDGGRTEGGPTPPVVARLAFPPEWRVLLVFDRAAEGVHGEREREAFAELPAFSEITAGQLCRCVLMQALPALIECDLLRFGAAIEHIQRAVGDYFAPAQGGGRFLSAAVEKTVAALVAQGAVGGGQTSWGPTGFAFAASEAEAERIAARVRPLAAGLSVEVFRALDRGARIDAVYARLASA